MSMVDEGKEKSLRSQLIAWIKLFRIPFVIGPGILPFSLGSLLALHAIPALNWPVFVIGNGGVVAILLVAFLLNEYFDYTTDLHNRDFNRYSGGSRILPSGIIRREAVLIVIAALIAITLLVGLVLQWGYHTGKLTLVLGGLGFLAGVFYTASPLRGSYRGVGELLIGISCGWLTLGAGYYLQTGRISLEVSLLSVPLVWSITAVILINEFPDYLSDKMDNKKTLVVRLGDAGAAQLYMLLLVLTFVSIMSNLIILPRAYLWYNLGMLGAIPLVVKNILAMKAHLYRDKKILEKICGRTALLHLSLSGVPLIIVSISRL